MALARSRPALWLTCRYILCGKGGGRGDPGSCVCVCRVRTYGTPHHPFFSLHFFLYPLDDLLLLAFDLVFVFGCFFGVMIL